MDFRTLESVGGLRSRDCIVALVAPLALSGCTWFSAAQDSQSYLVSNEIFVNIPQKSGGPRQVPFRDARLRRQLDALYRNAGGVPEA